MESLSVTEYRRQFGSIVQMYQACMHVGKRSALVKKIIVNLQLCGASFKAKLFILFT